MVKVFAVILNWNRYQDTYECLQSLRRQKMAGIDFRAVVVDNGSNKETLQKLEKIKFKSFKTEFVKNKKNLGFAAGNNVGIKKAIKEGADFVLVINNDTIADENLVQELLNEMEKDQKTGAVSPLIYFARGFEFHKGRYSANEQGRAIWYAGGIIDWPNVYGVNRGVDEVDIGQYNGPSETDFATGACMLLRAKVIEEIGDFDEKYFMYLEDVDLSLRLKRAGWRTKFNPKAKLWHKVAQSSGIGSDLNDYYLTRNRLLFGMHHASLRTKVALFKESIKFLLKGRKWQKIGTKDFYLGKFGKGSWK